MEMLVLSELLEKVQKYGRVMNIYMEAMPLPYKMNSKNEMTFQKVSDKVYKQGKEVMSKNEFLEYIEDITLEEFLQLGMVMEYKDVKEEEFKEELLATFVPETNTIVILSRFRYYYINRGMVAALKYFNFKIYKTQVELYNKRLSQNTVDAVPNTLKILASVYSSVLAIPNKIGCFRSNNIADSKYLNSEEKINFKKNSLSSIVPIGAFRNSMGFITTEPDETNFSYIFLTKNIIDELADNGINGIRQRASFNRVKIRKICLDFLIQSFNADLHSELRKQIGSNYQLTFVYNNEMFSIFSMFSGSDDIVLDFVRDLNDTFNINLMENNESLFSTTLDQIAYLSTGDLQDRFSYSTYLNNMKGVHDSLCNNY